MRVFLLHENCDNTCYRGVIQYTRFRICCVPASNRSARRR
nr:MAG TPA: hypothetical protein [Caudoviricetes sp.]